MNYGKRSPESDSVLKRGGVVLNVALNQEELARNGIQTNIKKLYRVMKPSGMLAKAAPRNLLRWRDELTVNAVANPGALGEGIYFERKAGKGTEIFLQVSPEMLAGRYKTDKKREEAVSWSVVRLRQLIGRIQTANGADSSAELAAKLCDLNRSSDYQMLNSWQILGPYFKPDGKAKDVLSARYSGEEQALKGDTNPNFTYKTDDGGNIDFRKTAEAGANGFVDIGHALNWGGKRALAFAVREIVVKEPYTALLRLGFDWYMLVYLNGELVADFSRGHGSGASPNKFKVKIKLKKGVNILTFKVLSGSLGFGFFANLSTPEAKLEGADAERREMIYDSQIKLKNPYEYFYW